MVSGHWSLWGVNVGLNQILEHGSVICWAAQWVGEDKVMWNRQGNKDFLTKIHSLLDKADAILTYNGKKFDLPLLNLEFVKAGLPPPAPYRHLDLLETVKKQFRFPSNKLEYVASQLDITQKIAHEGFPLWVKCRDGDRTAWKNMKEYNVGDIITLGELYNKIKPWISGHPNESLYNYSTDTQCTTCGGVHLQKRGFHVTGVGRYQRYRCKDCGSWSRSRISDVGKEERASLLAPM